MDTRNKRNIKNAIKLNENIQEDRIKVKVTRGKGQEVKQTTPAHNMIFIASPLNLSPCTFK